tara:strand:- start:400 stop:957 length:558 start_codon:yes stop_codon:yes gene_type:complete
MQAISESEMNGFDQEMLLSDFWDTMVERYKVVNNRERRNIIYKFSFLVSSRELTSLSLSSIGKRINKDHASVLHAIKQHPVNYMYDKHYREVYDQVYDSLSKKVETFTDNINGLMQQRISKLDAEMFNDVMVKVYKNKLDKQQIANDLHIETLKRDNSVLKTQLKNTRERERWLNDECLRLKNLL